jgi:hypothetical protein
MQHNTGVNLPIKAHTMEMYMHVTQSGMCVERECLGEFNNGHTVPDDLDRVYT